MTSFAQLIPVFVGALLATAAALGANLLLHFLQQKSLRAAFHGELSAIMNMIERRDYITHLQAAIDEMNATGREREVYFHVRRSFMNVFEKNVDKIGHLGPIAGDVITVYNQILGVLEDNDTLRELREKRGDGNNPKNVPRIIHHTQELLNLLKDTLSKGKEVILALKR